MRLRLFSAGIAAILSITIFGGPATALTLDPVDVVKSTLAGKVVNDIFSGVDQTITNAINQAQNAGNGLIMHTANQASILEQDAFLLLADQRQKTFEQLGDAEQKLLIEMQQWRLAVDKAVSAAYDIVDTINLDTSFQLANLPFTHVPDFFVQSIHGVSFLKQPAADYKVTLSALNLGIRADRKSEISVLLDNQPVTIITPDQNALNRAVITLPNGALAPYFQQDHLRTVPLIIRITMTRTGWLQNILYHAKTYEIPVTLTLYPELAATIALEVHFPHYDWVPIGQVPGAESAMTEDKDGKCKGDPACCANGTVELKVRNGLTSPPGPGDQRIDSCKLDCTTNPSYPFYRSSTDLFENNSHAVIHFQTWSGPVKMRVLATSVSEYRRRAEDDKVTLPMNIYFDHTTQVAAPGDFNALIAHVKTFTGKTYDFLPDTQVDPNGLIVKATITAGPAPTRLVVLTAKEPF
jgi:hypothetical protein